MREFPVWAQGRAVSKVLQGHIFQPRHEFTGPPPLFLGGSAPMEHILAIDQGTTSSRAVVYDRAGRALGTAAHEFSQHFPRPGWVEHDAEEIWESVARVVPEALRAAGIDGRKLAAIGLT